MNNQDSHNPCGTEGERVIVRLDTDHPLLYGRIGDPLLDALVLLRQPGAQRRGWLADTCTENGLKRATNAAARLMRGETALYHLALLLTPPSNSGKGGSLNLG